jgi:DNA-binding transcriptional MerR regulator
MARPRFDRQHEGLTRTEVAAQLGYSPSNVRRLQKAGLLPLRKDRNGIYRFRPHEVAEVARKLGRIAKTDGQTAAPIYGYFLTPGFKPTSEAIGRVVFETGEHPDLVRALWEKFKEGVGAPASEEAKEIDRLSREYDEQIAAMDEELAQKRRSAFIPGDPRDEAKKPRRTGT